MPQKLGVPSLVKPWNGAVPRGLSYVGFIGDTSCFVVLDRRDDSVGVYDAESGALVHKALGRLYSDLL